MIRVHIRYGTPDEDVVSESASILCDTIIAQDIQSAVIIATEITRRRMAGADCGMMPVCLYLDSSTVLFYRHEILPLPPPGRPIKKLTITRHAVLQDVTPEEDGHGRTGSGSNGQ